MPAPVRPPEVRDEDAPRKARLILSVVWTMIGLTTLGLVVSLFDPHNDLGFTLGFYAALYASLFAFATLVHRGHVTLAAWVVALWFWCLTAVVTLFFGGLQGQNATAFGGCILMIGVLVGGRAAVALAVASSGWCALLVALELTDRLPRQIGGYSPTNSWAAATITFVLISVLLRASLDSLRRMHLRERTAARERDEVLRRSIQAQKMEVVGSLTASIAHDFNNLLTVIGSAGGMLRESIAKRPVTDAVLDDLDVATSRASMMTRQLLALGRTATSEAITLDLGAVVERLATMLPRLLGPGIAVRVEVAPNCRIRAAALGLEQIVLNLAVNARDAMAGDGTLRLVVAARGDDVVLEVGDDGVGMDEATRQRAFEPFFTTKTNGTGLGLATVQAQVLRFGGTVEIRSALGEGTTFTLRFPRLQGADAELPEPPAVGPGVAGPHARLLLVEDDPLVRRAMARLLELEGFEVVSVADGQEALALVDASMGFDIVVSDVSMPRLDGESLARRLGERHPALPVLLMSGNQAPHADVLAAPGRAFLEKPIDRAAMREALARLLSPVHGAS